MTGTPTGTAAEVIAQARLEVGYDEQTGNRTKFAAEAGHPNGQAWCSTFIAALMRRCKVPVPPAVLVPSSRTMYAAAKAKGWAVTIQDLRPGDIIHTWRGATLGRWLGHVALVIAVNRNAAGRIVSVVTIEGNTNSAGSATGGSVLKKVRPVAWWRLGAWRPPYRAAP